MCFGKGEDEGLDTLITSTFLLLSIASALSLFTSMYKSAIPLPGASQSISVAASRSQPVPSVFIPNISLDDNQVFLKFTKSPNNGTQWDIEIEFDENSSSRESEFCLAFPHAKSANANKLDVKV